MQTFPKHSSSLWLPYWQRKRQARVRIFCLPYAGGGASLFRDLIARAPEALEICPIQLPGRENRVSEAPFMHMAPLLETLKRVLQPYLDMPYAFFGHSMGALICFELARVYEQDRQTAPLHLFVSGHAAPHLPTSRPHIRHLPEVQFLEELRRFKGTPEEVLQHKELVQMLVPLLRADFSLCETYNCQPAPPLVCPISAFSGLQDQEVPPEAITGWHTQTSGAFRARFWHGNHFFVRHEHERLLTAFTKDLFGED